jgi:hypothetical protein
VPAPRATQGIPSSKHVRTTLLTSAAAAGRCAEVYSVICTSLLYTGTGTGTGTGGEKASTGE